MFKEIQDFLNFLDNRTARKKAEKTKEVADKKTEAAKEKAILKEEEEKNQLSTLQTRKKQLTVNVAGWTAAYSESILIGTMTGSRRTTTVARIENEEQLKEQIARANKELEFVGAEIDELTKSEDT